jgi:hypothetical protein
MLVAQASIWHTATASLDLLRRASTLLDLLPGLGHASVIVREARCLALLGQVDHARGTELCLAQVFEFLTFLEFGEVAEEVWQISKSA